MGAAPDEPEVQVVAGGELEPSLVDTRPTEEIGDTDEKGSPPAHHLPPPMPPNHGHIEPTPPDEGSPFPAGEPHGPQTPQATSAFVDHAGLGGVDPGIAAGSRYVLVCDDHNGLAVYDKAGKLLGPKAAGHPFPNPFTFDSLFSKVKADIDPQLNYPPGLPPGFSANGIIAYGDHRVTFDHYRKRFWIYAMAKNLPPGFWVANTIMTYPDVKLVRRDKAAVRVWGSKDPREASLTYGGTTRSTTANPTIGKATRTTRSSRPRVKAPTIRASRSRPSISWRQSG